MAGRVAVLMAGRGLGVRALARQVLCNHVLTSRYLNGLAVAYPGTPPTVLLGQVRARRGPGPAIRVAWRAPHGRHAISSLV